jgi:integrase/recombinase XerD
LRVSELISLTGQDLHLGTAAQRELSRQGPQAANHTAHSRTVAVLRAWMTEHVIQPRDPMFPTRSGQAMSPDAVEHRIALYTHTATRSCPSLASKKITAHTLRHTAAMQLLHAGVDTGVIALWLGPEKVDTTQIYIHADLEIKQRAARGPIKATPARPISSLDSLIAFLDALRLC